MTRLADRLTRVPRGGGSDRGARRGACHPAPAVTATATTQAWERRAARGQTLDELLVGAWEDLRTASATDCPVCGGTMLSRRGSGAGGCEDCGSELC